MKIILANGTELTPIMVTGAKKTVQGATRDTLTFIFPADQGMETIDALFSAENCESIKLYEPKMITKTDDEGNEVTVETVAEYIYSGYTIRAELSKKSVEVAPATEETEAVYEDRIIVSMSQRTYTETQIANLTETVDVLVLESLMA